MIQLLKSVMKIDTSFSINYLSVMEILTSIIITVTNTNIIYTKWYKIIISFFRIDTT